MSDTPHPTEREITIGNMMYAQGYQSGYTNAKAESAAEIERLRGENTRLEIGGVGDFVVAACRKALTSDGVSNSYGARDLLERLVESHDRLRRQVEAAHRQIDVYRGDDGLVYSVEADSIRLAMQDALAAGKGGG